MTIYELIHFKKMVRVWKTKSPLFCLRYDPLIVFRRQNHITFIFIKTMSHDLLVQMAYSILMTRHYPDLGSASDWLIRILQAARPIRSTTQIWIVTRHQYGISALVSILRRSLSFVTCCVNPFTAKCRPKANFDQICEFHFLNFDKQIASCEKYRQRAFIWMVTS